MIRQSDCGADNPKQVKRFKCANENKNIAIIGFKNLMKAHKHKQTLDLDLLWIHLVSCILLEKCHCNIFAMAVSVYPLVTGQPTESHMSYDIKKKMHVLSIFLILGNLHSIFSIIHTILSHTGGGCYFAASGYLFILMFSVTIASELSFASSSWPGAACLAD